MIFSGEMMFSIKLIILMIFFYLNDKIHLVKLFFLFSNFNYPINFFKYNKVKHITYE